MVASSIFVFAVTLFSTVFARAAIPGRAGLHPKRDGIVQSDLSAIATLESLVQNDILNLGTGGDSDATFETDMQNLIYQLNVAAIDSEGQPPISDDDTDTINAIFNVEEQAEIIVLSLIAQNVTILGDSDLLGFLQQAAGDFEDGLGAFTNGMIGLVSADVKTNLTNVFTEIFIDFAYLAEVIG